MNKKLRTTEEKLEAARSALRVIQTWADFEFGELPQGHALDPDQVSDLCARTLKETE